MLDIIGIIIALLMLGILVFVHELGHFIVAKLNKIGVDEFSIGFGKELIGFTWGETRYRVGVIPFGGYCKMRGEETKDRKGGVSDPRAMYNRPAISRLLTVAAGPFFNYIFAILILSLLFFAGYKETLITTDITVIGTNSNGKLTPIAKAGLMTGDHILSIGGENLKSFTDIPRLVALDIGKELSITYLRAGTTNQTKITPEYNDQSGLGFIGVSPLYYAVVGAITTNSPAAAAGLKTGDTILSINGKKISYFSELQSAVEPLSNQSALFILQRENSTITQAVQIGRFEGKGYLGIGPGKMPTFENTIRASNPIDAVQKGFNEANNAITETWQSLKALFSGKINVQRNISGPVRIIAITGEIATKTDAATLIRLMALISVALAFFNLLPLPGLDGGHVVFNFIELVSRRRFPEKIRTYIEFAGLFVIFSLSILVLFNDIFNLWLGR